GQPVGQEGRTYVPQPGYAFGPSLSRELIARLMRLENRLLHAVRPAELAAQPPVQVLTGEQVEVDPVVSQVGHAGRARHRSPAIRKETTSARIGRGKNWIPRSFERASSHHLTPQSVASRPRRKLVRGPGQADAPAPRTRRDAPGPALHPPPQEQTRQPSRRQAPSRPDSSPRGSSAGRSMPAATPCGTTSPPPAGGRLGHPHGASAARPCRR